MEMRLTAADEWLVVGGHSRLASHSESRSRQTRQVREIIVHPDFIVHTMYSDIALLRLDRPFNLGPDLRRVCLPLVERLPQTSYQRCYVAGWGKVSPDGLLNILLLYFSKHFRLNFNRAITQWFYSFSALTLSVNTRNSTKLTNQCVSYAFRPTSSPFSFHARHILPTSKFQRSYSCILITYFLY